MTRWKRLLIDWYWPDQVTFLTKGRRYGLLWMAVALLALIGLTVFALVLNRMFTAEINPFMNDLIVRLESASQGKGQATAEDLQKAAEGLEICRSEFSSVPTFYLPLLALLLFLLGFSAGVFWLRAHQVVCRMIQARTPESPLVDS